jgi:hypothetical protein
MVSPRGLWGIKVRQNIPLQPILTHIHTRSHSRTFTTTYKNMATMVLLSMMSGLKFLSNFKDGVIPRYSGLMLARLSPLLFVAQGVYTVYNAEPIVLGITMGKPADYATPGKPPPILTLPPSSTFAPPLTAPLPVAPTVPVLPTIAVVVLVFTGAVAAGVLLIAAKSRGGRGRPPNRHGSSSPRSKKTRKSPKAVGPHWRRDDDDDGPPEDPPPPPSPGPGVGDKSDLPVPAGLIDMRIIAILLTVYLALLAVLWRTFPKEFKKLARKAKNILEKATFNPSDRVFQEKLRRRLRGLLRQHGDAPATPVAQDIAVARAIETDRFSKGLWAGALAVLVVAGAGARYAIQGAGPVIEAPNAAVLIVDLAEDGDLPVNEHLVADPSLPLIQRAGLAVETPDAVVAIADPVEDGDLPTTQRLVVELDDQSLPVDDREADAIQGIAGIERLPIEYGKQEATKPVVTSFVKEYGLQYGGAPETVGNAGNMEDGPPFQVAPEAKVSSFTSREDLEAEREAETTQTKTYIEAFLETLDYVPVVVEADIEDENQVFEDTETEEEEVEKEGDIIDVMLGNVENPGSEKSIATSGAVRGEQENGEEIFGQPDSEPVSVEAAKDGIPAVQDEDYVILEEQLESEMIFADVDDMEEAAEDESPVNNKWLAVVENEVESLEEVIRRKLNAEGKRPETAVSFSPYVISLPGLIPIHRLRTFLLQHPFIHVPW